MSRGSDNEFGRDDRSPVRPSDEERAHTAEVVPFPYRQDEAPSAHQTPQETAPATAEPVKSHAGTASAIQQVLSAADVTAKQLDISPIPEIAKDPPRTEVERAEPANTSPAGAGTDTPAVTTGRGGNDPPKNGGGGGRGGGGSPPLHKRSSDNEFRDVLGKGLANARRNLVTVGIFSVAVNLLVLAIPVYLFNMSDRVMTSRSTDTLVMLSMIVIVAIAAHVLMDMMRRIILMRIAVDVEGTGVTRQQGVVVAAHGLRLGRVEAQHALGVEARQLGAESRDVVGALLRLAAQWRVHGWELCLL